MTVTISSTTDTEAEVKEASIEANPDEAKTAPGESESTAAPAPVESQAEFQLEAEEDAPVAVASDSTDAEPELAVEEEGPTEPDVTARADEDEEEAATDTPKRKRRRQRRGRSYKERASQLAREKSIEKSRADALEARLASINQAPPPATPAPGVQESEQKASPGAEATPAEDDRPQQDKFETYDEYQEALVDWKVSQRLTAHEAVERDRIAREETQRAQESLVAAHTARIDTFRSEHDDFDAVVERGKDLPMTRPMQDAVLNSEEGPAVMYHLCQNPEECDRIAGLHPMLAIKEMGKLEARLEAARTGPASSAEPLTRAPRPIKPVGGGHTASTVPMDKLPYQDFKRAREIELGIRER